jgi:hypothetical protein
VASPALVKIVPPGGPAALIVHALAGHLNAVTYPIVKAPLLACMCGSASSLTPMMFSMISSLIPPLRLTRV